MLNECLRDMFLEEVVKTEDAIWLGTNKAKRLLSDWEVLAARCSDLKVKLYKLNRMDENDEGRDALVKEIEVLRDFVLDELDRLNSLY